MGEMKEKYESPEMEFVVFETEDVILSSNELEPFPDEVNP